MPVDSQHPDYTKSLKRWAVVRKVVANDASDWIRVVDENDQVRSKQYRQDAILTNFTALTKNGLTGLVFRRKPKIAIPSNMNYLLLDATGEDLNLLQLNQKIVGEVLETGRHGVLIDYPDVGPMSLAQQQISGNVARFKTYPAESIINWKTDIIGSKTFLSLVVLVENVDTLGLDGFAWHSTKQYRVLQLVNGVYSQCIYQETSGSAGAVGGSYDYLSDGIPSGYQNDTTEQGQYKKVAEFTPLKSDGSTWGEIPFMFFGSINNDPKMDVSPLYDLAVLNLGHYRNSADYEESIFICGQPTVFLHGEASLEEFQSLYPEGIRMGARSGYYLGINGGATLLQPSPNQLADAAMKRKEEQAVAIGARIIAPPGGRETAEAARIRYASQNSSLYLITTNISLGMTKCLEWVAAFMGVESYPVNLVLNDQFYDDAADPNVIAQQIMLLQNSVIGKGEIRDYLRTTGVIDDEITNEELDKEIKADPYVPPAVPTKPAGGGTEQQFQP